MVDASFIPPRRRRRRDDGEDRALHLELSPLIDMVFILLIFFVVTTTFERSRAVDVQRPRAAHAQSQDPGSVVVSISGNGQASIDGRPFHPDQIQVLRSHLAGRSNRSVLIQADGQVSTDVLVRVMDSALAAGASGLAVMADVPQAGGSR